MEDKFILKVYKKPLEKLNAQGCVKINDEAVKALELVQRESGLSFRTIASQMIIFAAERYEIVEL